MAISDDRQAILDLMSTWREATLRGDLPAILALMTEDAVFLRPGHEPMTRARFIETFQGVRDGMKLEAAQDVKDLQVSGDLAYAWTWLDVAVVLADGSRGERSGHVLTVFRRSAEGRWQLARDANLLMPRSP